MHAIAPRVVVALGATAARSLTGKTVAIAANRGTEFDLDGRTLLVTFHPSAVLRGDERAEKIREAIVEDLRRAVRIGSRTGNRRVGSPRRGVGHPAGSRRRPLGT